MTTVTSLGLLRTRLDERFAQLQEDYRSIFGSDIQIDADDIDGQWLGIIAERISDVDQLVEDVYNSFNPQTTTGVSLSRLVQLNGIRRLAGAYSTVDQLVCEGTVGVVIPAGSQVKSTVDNTTWVTTADGTIDSGGSVTVVARRTEMDSTSAAIGTLTKIDTPIYGWQTVTNADIAVAGRLEETDEELRVRRRESTNTPAQCITDAVYGAIKDLSGVRLARVYENDQDDVDANGQAPHSIYCVVEGGDADEIAQVIWVHKTAGTTSVGDIATDVTDIQGGTHSINFSRPDYTDVYITVNVTKLPGYPADGDQQIIDALVAWGVGLDEFGNYNLTIGTDLLDTRLYSPVNTVPNHYITALKIGTSPSPSGTSNITIPFDGLCRILEARIVVVSV